MNTFGNNFRVSIFGESHGEMIGVTLDGVPSGLELCQQDFKKDIDRRRSGAKGTTPRSEADEPHIVSGVYEGHTTGAPLTVLFKNTNTRSGDYSEFQTTPRPGHADFSGSERFGGWNDPRGGGHFSGRLTLPVVAAGVVAKKVLASRMVALSQNPENFGEEVQNPDGPSIDARIISMGGSDDPQQWNELLEQAMKEGDSLGALVECSVQVPAGLGEPFWNSVESLISHAIFSIPGVRGIEFGDGFKAADMKGSQHNDPFGVDGLPAKNGSGGVNGGITNGAPIVFRVAFKPTSSISKPQKTLNFETGKLTDLVCKGRHDACFALRTPVIVEAMAAIVLADLLY